MPLGIATSLITLPLVGMCSPLLLFIELPLLTGEKVGKTFSGPAFIQESLAVGCNFFFFFFISLLQVTPDLPEVHNIYYTIEQVLEKIMKLENISKKYNNVVSNTATTSRKWKRITLQ